MITFMDLLRHIMVQVIIVRQKLPIINILLNALFVGKPYRGRTRRVTMWVICTRSIDSRQSGDVVVEFRIRRCAGFVEGIIFI